MSGDVSDKMREAIEPLHSALQKLMSLIDEDTAAVEVYLVSSSLFINQNLQLLLLSFCFIVVLIVTTVSLNTMTVTVEYWLPPQASVQ